MNFKRLILLILLVSCAAVSALDMRKVWRLAATLTGAAALRYILDESEVGTIKLRTLKNNIEEYPESRSARVSEVKNFLVETAPARHKELAAQVKFFEADNFSASGLASHPAIIFPKEDKEDGCNFFYLHELAHIIHNDAANRVNFERNSLTFCTAGFGYSLLKSTGIKSFCKRVIIGLPAYLLGVGLFVANGSGIKTYIYQQETRADQVAINCLKEHKDIKSLKAASDYFRKDISTPVQIKVEKLHPFFRPLYSTHPSSRDRLKWIEAAINEIKE